MINENEIFINELLKSEKNEIITIDGEWWNLGKRKYIGKLEIIPSKIAILEAEYEEEDSGYIDYGPSPTGIPVIFGKSDCFGELTLLNCEGYRDSKKEGSKIKYILKVTVKGVTSGKHLESFKDLKFKTLILDYEYYLKNVGLRETFEEIEWKDYKIFLNNKNIKIEYKEEQHFYDFLEIINYIEGILSFLERYPCYPTGIIGITVNGEQVNLLYLKGLKYTQKNNEDFLIEKNLRKKILECMYMIRITEIIKIILNEENLHLYFFRYFQILEWIREKIVRIEYIFSELYKIVEYYGSNGQGKIGEGALRKVFQKIENYISKSVIEDILKEILERRDFLFDEDNFKKILSDKDKFKDKFIKEAKTIRDYLTHFNSKNLDSIGGYKKLMEKIFPLTLSFLVLSEIILLILILEKKNLSKDVIEWGLKRVINEVYKSTSNVIDMDNYLYGGLKLKEI
jgi:hypothetical protein